jgi:hypothetical protein
LRLVERYELQEEHFTEGEPDLEPPEELALAELDEEQLLEEELDNEDISEDEVDEVTLELTLEHLVHQGDDEGRPDDLVLPIRASQVTLAEPGMRNGTSSSDSAHLDGPPGEVTPGHEEEDEEELHDLEVAELEDVEESLDHILAERLALEGGAAQATDEEEEEEEEEEEGPGHSWPTATALQGRHLIAEAGHAGNGTRGFGVSPCRADEFVCSSCYLVRSRTQLADRQKEMCRDCSA